MPPCFAPHGSSTQGKYAPSSSSRKCPFISLCSWETDVLFSLTPQHPQREWHPSLLSFLSLCLSYIDYCLQNWVVDTSVPTGLWLRVEARLTSSVNLPIHQSIHWLRSVTGSAHEDCSFILLTQPHTPEIQLRMLGRENLPENIIKLDAMESGQSGAKRILASHTLGLYNSKREPGVTKLFQPRCAFATGHRSRGQNMLSTKGRRQHGKGSLVHSHFPFQQCFLNI